MLRLPASPAALLREVITPALTILPVGMGTRDARCMLVATSYQESEINARVQHGGGPAHGLWQFERGGGVRGVLEHDASEDLAAMVCREAHVAPNARAVHYALAKDDLLACRFARLLLWTDAARLPPANAASEELAWKYYLRTWRPGKPHRSRWAKAWALAVEAVA